MELQSLADCIRRAEMLYGGREAVTCGEVRLTYRAFASRCRRLAGALSNHGVGFGDRVAVLMLNCHRYLEAYFAVPGMGAIIVPLNNRHTIAEHRYILEDAEPKVLIVDEAHVAVAEELESRVSHVVVAPRSYEEMLATVQDVPLPGPSSENAVAGLFYTGGTTGAAKGVMLSHRNLLTNAYHTMIAMLYGAEDVYLHAGPMFHLGDGMSTYSITWIGGRHVFVPAFQPDAVVDVIEKERVTCSLWVPTMINLIINNSRAATADLSSLRVVAHGGAPIAQHLLERAIAAFGCSFTQAYGMTEAAPLVTALPNEERLIGDAKLRSAGREVVGVEVTVRRPDGRRCDTGEFGEVVARGPNFMLGYWRKPEQTTAAVRDGWYWSGDGGYLDQDHYLYVVDRLKDMIITGGENVYSTEVENAIYAHPGVLECAVIGVPDETWGERVHAVVVLKPGHQTTEHELREHCKTLIAGYKAPWSVDIWDQPLPKSGAGKILKRELREKYWMGLGRQVN